MRASRKWVAVGVAVGSLALLPAGAGAAPIDTASDHAALVAYHSYVEGLLSSLPAAHTAMADYVSSISARCPDVLAPIAALPSGSVNNGAALAVGEELGEDLDAAAYPALRAPFARFARVESVEESRLSAFLAAMKQFLSPSDAGLVDDTNRAGQHYLRGVKPILTSQAARLFTAVGLSS